MKFLDKLNLRDKKTQLIILVVLFAISGFSIFYMRSSRSSTTTGDNLAVKPAEQRKSSTKLAFIDEKKLPKTYTPGEKITIDFFIQNHEGKTLDYLYTVTVNGKQAAAHSLTIKDKTTQNVEQAFALPSDQQSLLIEVKLPTQNQSIKFTVDRAK